MINRGNELQHEPFLPRPADQFFLVRSSESKYSISSPRPIRCAKRVTQQLFWHHILWSTHGMAAHGGAFEGLRGPSLSGLEDKGINTNSLHLGWACPISQPRNPGRKCRKPKHQSTIISDLDWHISKLDTHKVCLILKESSSTVIFIGVCTC